MGIGMVIVLDKKHAQNVKPILEKHCSSYEIGHVAKGNKTVQLT